jgi:O-antigen/teichoic acid export membrane protein
MVLLISMQLYPWFLLYFYGSAAAGVYAACIGLVALFNPLVLGLGNFFGPKAVHSYRQGAKKLYKLVKLGATIYATIAVVLCVLLIMFGGRFLAIIYGSKYVGHGLVVSILAISSAISIVGEPASYGIWAMERPATNFKINLIALTMTVTLGLWLVNSFGTLGVALGLLASNVAASLMRYAAFARLAPSVPN